MRCSHGGSVIRSQVGLVVVDFFFLKLMMASTFFLGRVVFFCQCYLLFEYCAAWNFFMIFFQEECGLSNNVILQVEKDQDEEV